MRIVCDNAYHDRGEGVCSFCVEVRIAEAVKAERERCAKIAEESGNLYGFNRTMAYRIGDVIRQSTGEGRAQ